MDRRIPDLLEALRSCDDITPAFHKIERWAKEGNTELLCELASAALTEMDKDLNRKLLMSRVWEHVRNVIALRRGFPQASATIRLAHLLLEAKEQPERADEALREMASQTAFTHSPRDLRRLFRDFTDDPGSSEFLNLLTQEMVIRGVRCDKLPEVAEHGEKAKSKGHPLASLPLRLTSIEGQAKRYAPNYGPTGGWGIWLPYSPYRKATKVVRISTTAAPVRAKEVRGQAESRVIELAF
ncbi:MAG: hypothetical protein HY318_19885 [Armatimonadetes bacterium]|nr:hypothetical protein [Armatimonadota bacterium]